MAMLKVHLIFFQINLSSASRLRDLYPSPQHQGRLALLSTEGLKPSESVNGVCHFMKKEKFSNLIKISWLLLGLEPASSRSPGTTKASGKKSFIYLQFLKINSCISNLII